MSVHRTTRAKVYRRDDNLCRYCGKRVRDDSRRHFIWRRTIDHVIPRSRGGSNLMANLVTACEPCNTFKGDRLIEEIGMFLLPPGTIRIEWYAVADRR